MNRKNPFVAISVCLSLSLVVIFLNLFSLLTCLYPFLLSYHLSIIFRWIFSPYNVFFHYLSPHLSTYLSLFSPVYTLSCDLSSSVYFFFLSLHLYIILSLSLPLFFLTSHLSTFSLFASVHISIFITGSVFFSLFSSIYIISFYLLGILSIFPYVYIFSFALLVCLHSFFPSFYTFFSLFSLNSTWRQATFTSPLSWSHRLVT